MDAVFRYTVSDSLVRPLKFQGGEYSFPDMLVTRQWFSTRGHPFMTSTRKSGF